MAERRQWSSAAPNPRRKTRVKLWLHFWMANVPSHQICLNRRACWYSGESAWLRFFWAASSKTLRVSRRALSFRLLFRHRPFSGQLWQSAFWALYTQCRLLPALRLTLVKGSSFPLGQRKQSLSWSYWKCSRRNSTHGWGSLAIGRTKKETPCSANT